MYILVIFKLIQTKKNNLTSIICTNLPLPTYMISYNMYWF